MNDSIVKIGIVDDHAIVRAGLKQFLSEMVDLRVVGEAASGREAIDLVRTMELDAPRHRMSASSFSRDIRKSSTRST